MSARGYHKGRAFDFHVPERIRDVAAYLNGLDLDIFNECFPGRIMMSDTDGKVERNRYLLYVEAKSVKSGVTSLRDMPRGQSLTHRAELEPPGRSLLVLSHDTPTSVVIYSVYTRTLNGELRKVEDVPTSNAGVIRLISSWYKWADSSPRPVHVYSQSDSTCFHGDEF